MTRADQTGTDIRTGWYLTSLAAAMLVGLAGCVTQSTYDTQVAETTDLQQTLARAQAESADVARQVAALHTANKDLNATVEDLRAAIKRAEDTIAARRKKAQDRLSALKTQVAALTEQSRVLKRNIADAKRSNVSLLASEEQFKRELEELIEQAALATEAPASPQPPQTTPVAQPIPVQQTARATPAALTQPVPATPAAPAQPASRPTQNSWFGWLFNWLSDFWFSLFE